MSLSQPSPPNAGDLAGVQTQLNLGAAQAQQGLNEFSSYGPLGSTVFNGQNIYQSLNPKASAALDQSQWTQNYLARLGSNLAKSMGQSGQYSTPPDFTSASAPLVQSQMAAFNKYMQPTYTNQLSNLQSQLASQGITQGSDAWNNDLRGYYNSQDQANQSALMNFEPQAYQQAVQSYELPLQTLMGLFGAGMPQTSLPQLNGPQVQVQPANYMGAAEQQFGQQQQQFQNTMSGLGQAGGGLFNGLFGGGGATGGAGGAGAGLGNILSSLFVPAIG